MTAGRPKLMLFSHICNPVHFTGAEKLLIAFAKEMQRLFECVLVVPNEGAIAAEARNSGMQVFVSEIPISVAMYVAMPHLNEEIETLRSSRFWESLIALLQSERPDYVWANTCVNPLPAMAAKALGIPVIWALMETIYDGPKQKVAIGIIDTHSDRIVGISQSVLAPLPKEIVEAKATVLSPYLEREALLPDSWSYHRYLQRRANGWGEQHLVVGFIASTIYPNKGLKEFLQAVLPLAAEDPRIRMLIVGHPAEEGYVAECREQIRKAGLADRASWISFLPRIEQIYPTTDVVVVPSVVSEGFGMAALEGMFFGKPVVAFSSGGLAEILEATGNGEWLVPAGDVPGLRAAVARLLKNDELRDKIGQRNAHAAAERFGAPSFRRALDAFAASLPPAREPLPLPELVTGSGPAIYRIENGRKRRFPSLEALLRLGYRLEDVVRLPDDRLSVVPDGPPMSLPADPGRRARRSVRRRRPRLRGRARRSKRRAGRIKRVKGIKRARSARRARSIRRSGIARRVIRARRARVRLAQGRGRRHRR